MTAEAARHAYATAESEMDDSPVGSMFVGGTDVLTKRHDERWVRAKDGAVFRSADVADFHGWSGYAIVPAVGSQTEEP